MGSGRSACFTESKGTRVRNRMGLLAIAAAFLLAASPVVASVASELAFHQGVVAFEDGQLEEAREQFEIVLAEDPADVAAIHYLGMIADDQGRQNEAIELFRRAIALKPDDADLQFDLGAALLETGRNQEALETFEGVLEREPDRARAHLYAGIAMYRLRDYAAATPHLERAVKLDPDLSREANYYRGLTLAYQGDFSAAAGALGVVERQSPMHPLGRSASELRAGMQAQEPPQPWELALTSGIEYDSNPLLVGSDIPIGEEDDFRAVMRLRTSYRLVNSERFRLSAGYDGYLSVHEDLGQVDLFTNVGWAAGSVRIEPVRLNLRYDFAFTKLDLNRKYQRVHRITPSITVAESRWGLSEFFYQYQDIDYFFDNPLSDTDRDGQQHTVGVNQFFFLEDPVQYLRIGALYDDYDPQGDEFRYDGYELSAGLGVQLPWKVVLTASYRFVRRSFRNDTLFVGSDDIGTRRYDRINQFELELTRPIGESLEISLLAWAEDHDSTVPAFDYDRVIGGSYITYRF
jgi:tetratricopeptide (TPR) repeat protein